MASENDMQAVIDSARLGVAPIPLAHGLDYLPNANEGQGEIASREVFEARPYRKRGTIIVLDVPSLNRVIADNRDTGDVRVYLNQDAKQPCIVAVLNDHGTTGPGWADFRALLQFVVTPQWQKWMSIDGKMMTQADFAEFIEDNITDVAEPSGAAMLEIATYLQATRTVAFKSARRLSSGAVQFQNLEDIQASVGVGETAVPETFTLGIAPFAGCNPYRVPVRFRYRLSDGKLSLGVKLQRVEDLMQQIFTDMASAIVQDEGITVVDGIPCAPVAPLT